MIMILLAAGVAAAGGQRSDQGGSIRSEGIHQEAIAPAILRQIRCFARTIEPVIAGLQRERNPLLMVNGKAYGLVFGTADRCDGKASLPNGITSIEYLIPSAARQDFGKAAEGGLVRVDYTPPHTRR